MKSLPARLLITGAAGFLGHRLCRLAATGGWQVFGTVFQRRPAVEGLTPVALDLTDAAAVKSVVEQVAPHGVIHTAAASDPDFCQKHRRRSRRINVTATAELAEICAARGIAFVFTSSDLVFDGRHPPYRETDFPSPVSEYGAQKADAEAAVLKRHPTAAICRLPLMVGPFEPGGNRFEDEIARRLRAGKKARLFVDEYRTPVDTGSAARGLLLALERVSGLLHLGGRRRVSRYDLGVMIAEVLGADESLLIPVRQKDMLTAAPRPADVSLDSHRAYSIGYDPAPLAQAMAQVFEKS